MKAKTGYNLVMPTGTYESLQKIAEQDGTTIAELLRKAIRWFLFVRTIKLDPEARLLIEQDGEIKEIIVDLM